MSSSLISMPSFSLTRFIATDCSNSVDLKFVIASGSRACFIFVLKWDDLCDSIGSYQNMPVVDDL